MPATLQTLFKSRRFWVAFGGVVAIIAKTIAPQYFAGFSDEQIVAAAVVVGGWIVGESLRSSELVRESK